MKDTFNDPMTPNAASLAQDPTAPRSDDDPRFGKLQTADYWLSSIALKLLDKNHKYATKLCCHNATSECIRQNRDNIQNADEIILFGLGERVHHSIMFRPSEGVLFDYFEEGFIALDKENNTGLYYESDGTTQELDILKTISFREFGDYYIEAVEKNLQKLAPAPAKPHEIL